jgi:hypothetical protein
MRNVAWIICALGLPSAAFAEDIGKAGRCETQAKSTCASVPSARLTSPKGTVLLSRGAGFAEIKSGAALFAGDRLLVKQGLADVAFSPSCRTPLGPNSMVTLVEKDGVLCAARLSSDPNVVAADLPSRRPPPSEPESIVTQPVFNPAGLVVAAGLGIAVWALSREDDSGIIIIPPVSPASP